MTTEIVSNHCVFVKDHEIDALIGALVTTSQQTQLRAARFEQSADTIIAKIKEDYLGEYGTIASLPFEGQSYMLKYGFELDDWKTRKLKLFLAVHAGAIPGIDPLKNTAEHIDYLANFSPESR